MGPGCSCGEWKVVVEFVVRARWFAGRLVRSQSMRLFLLDIHERVATSLSLIFMKVVFG